MTMADDLHALTPTEFENFTFDLVWSMGLRNVTWRTPGADGGRDIQGEWSYADFAGHFSTDKWYVECKRYAASVDWPTVWQKIAYADSQAADFLLMVTPSSFSPKCLDEMEAWNRSHRSPRVRGWGAHDILARLQFSPSVAAKYGLGDSWKDKSMSALSDLALHIARANIAAKSSIAFGQSSSRYLIAASAMSELLMARSADLKVDGRSRRRPQMVAAPLHPWVNANQPFESKLFDAPGLRAFLAVVRMVDASSDVSFSDLGTELVYTASFPNKFRRPSVITLLSLIARWGFLEFSILGNNVVLKPQFGDGDG